ncbi:alpha/beta hydrolase fold domain-containing protein [Burkholderia sp. SCN-KJ]|uniref:alpha/beta hydrolase fold domain-containing protein n=1 Tax=Burkholderia sp. SCN-KJ TaxID=2969248 RepID=UPI00215003CD|nr:alpha/beta hydrolase [Burkholderia sp. SCN-KJ]MCR4470481.1 alpha/beta hydrolase [Burkholderia sp. SCN-KJ]
MQTNIQRVIEIRNVELEGHGEAIRLRLYRSLIEQSVLPIIRCFHAGGVTMGKLKGTHPFRAELATRVRALVISEDDPTVREFPFAKPLHDGHLPLRWMVKNPRVRSADEKRAAAARQDARDNLAMELATTVRDQTGFRFPAHAQLAQPLDPRMTRIANLGREKYPDMRAVECALGCRAYLRIAIHRLHPYAAPIESRRLKGPPVAFITISEHDLMHMEAGRYAARLMVSGVSTTVKRYANVGHKDLLSRQEVLADVFAFFSERPGAASEHA